MEEETIEEKKELISFATQVGFEKKIARRLFSEEYILDCCLIKNKFFKKNKKNNSFRIRRRLLGKNRATLNSIENKTETKIRVEKNKVWILGKEQNFFEAYTMVEKIILGRRNFEIKRKNDQ